jgi:hypothetical protein
VTLDEFIAAAARLRLELGGETPVAMLTACGYTGVLLTDGVGFSDERGGGASPIVLVVPAGPMDSDASERVERPRGA